MSRFILLNFEDFGLNQDNLTKTIQPYNPFCLCCLDRDGPMVDLDDCIHSDYLDTFGKAELSQYNQLVCAQCHSFMRKIKCFQQQVMESFQILLSGTYTNNTINNKRINNLTRQDTPEFIHLPPQEITPQNNIIPNSNIDIEPISTNTNLVEPIPTNTNLENPFINVEIPLEDNLNESSKLSLELNKNIKTALDILERNNQSFVTLGGQLQFLNGEHLSFLETSLLSKEILTDIPLVPAKMSTDLENGLIDNSKLEIEIDGPEKIFYDTLELSPELLSNVSTSEIIGTEIETIIETQKPEIIAVKQKKTKPKTVKNKPPLQIKPVRISQDELNKERVRKAQSETYLKFKFRCETCLLGFNYQENLEDHNKRKHGPMQGDNVLCDICSQVIPTVGAMTEHNYRHYTRYDCVHCGKRYNTRDEANQHLRQNHAKIKKRTQRIKKGKLRPLQNNFLL